MPNGPVPSCRRGPRLIWRTLDPPMHDRNRESVGKRLEALGFKVDVVREVPNEKRPDLVASKDNTTMFVEVKVRVEDRELRAKMESVGVGATKSIVISLDKHNSLSEHVEKANAQLGAAAASDDFRLLWFRADSGPFVHDPREQIGATLLGIRMVFAERNAERRVRPCIYAGYADLFRCREIDGVMIEIDGALTLVLNQFSQRQEAFACSPICAAVSPAIVDVQRNTREDLYYVVDSDVNRRDEDALLAFLRTKYPRDAFFHFASHCAGTTVTTIDARLKRGV